ncbi:ropporin-1-like protein [Sycon ciliatum]|uniref:ropporin-1-like protein n=1 Tax=Sycon ciliatum TaxID=27933 RepID=UPI0020AD0B91|eukprot:scpid65940/ scgid14740/ Ropporin-1-like protein
MTESQGFGPPEQQYCPEQIVIPPDLPLLLKNYTKAAIRTQPSDLVAWSASYFQAMRKGETLPVRHRLELPTVEKEALTERKLASLHRQLGDQKVVSVDTIRDRWQSVGAGMSILDANLRTGGWPDEINWLQFLVLGCGSITSGLKEAMKMFCRIHSDDDLGGAARVPFAVFTEVFNWLAAQDSKIGKKTQDDVLNYLSGQASQAAGMIGPRNIEHQDCPRF